EAAGGTALAEALTRELYLPGFEKKVGAKTARSEGVDRFVEFAFGNPVIPDGHAISVVTRSARMKHREEHAAVRRQLPYLAADYTCVFQIAANRKRSSRLCRGQLPGKHQDRKERQHDDAGRRVPLLEGPDISERRNQQQRNSGKHEPHVGPFVETEA